MNFDLPVVIELSLLNMEEFWDPAFNWIFLYNHYQIVSKKIIYKLLFNNFHHPKKQLISILFFLYQNLGSHTTH